MSAVVVTPDRAGRVLSALESRLDPAQPEQAGVEVLAYGEISAALLLPHEPAFAGVLAKRMSGFADAAMARKYVALVTEYLDRLARLGVRVVDTQPILIERGHRPPVVYLLQPLLDSASLGHELLRRGSDDDLTDALRSVLTLADGLFAANAASPNDEISVDAQLSNWSFGSGEPVLIDVGTPFIRRRGKHALDQEMLLSAVPPGVRNYYRWKGSVSEYMDDYFEPRLLAVDILGNFIKEGAAERIPLGLRVANAWLADHPGAADPVDEAEVREYYDADAATLELFLKVRRIDRFTRRLLRRRYDFILPGAVSR